MSGMYSVYLHRSKADDRVYIGTTIDTDTRWMPSKYRGSPAFYSAIKSEGWDGFSHEIVADRLTKKQAEIVERALIVAMKSTDPTHGYNRKK